MCSNVVLLLYIPRYIYAICQSSNVELAEIKRYDKHKMCETTAHTILSITLSYSLNIGNVK